MQKSSSGAKNGILTASLIALVVMLAGATTASAASRFSRNTGSWDDTNTWAATSGGASGVSAPVAGDAVTIELGKNVTVTNNAACASVNFTTTTATSLSIGPGVTLTVSGAITIPRSGSGVNLLAVGAGNLTAGSVQFSSAGISSSRHSITISTGSVTVAGNVSQSGLIVPIGGSSPSIVFSGAGLLKLGGSMYNSLEGTLTTVAGSIVEYAGAGAQTIHDFTYNNLVISGGGTKSIDHSVNVNGNLSIAPTGSAQINVGGGSSGDILAVNSLTLGGLGRSSGTWGSTTTSSAPTHQNNTYFVGGSRRVNAATDTRTTPVVTTAPTASEITFGKALSNSVLGTATATNVFGADVPGTCTFTSPGTVPPVGTNDQAVTFTPTDAGTYNTAATLASVVVVIKPAMYVLGANGDVVATNEVPSWDKGTFFGTVEIGQTLTNTFAITNLGLQTLTISGVATEGADAGQFQVAGMPPSILGGESSTFTIAFTATNVSWYSATVTITNNSTNAQAYLINLRGAGPLMPPVATTATGITGTNFVANWNASVGATNYFLDVATNSAFGAGDFVAGYSNLSVGNITSRLITPLLGHHDYYYQVRAQGTTGTNPTNSNFIAVHLPNNLPVANTDAATILEDSASIVMNILGNDTDADNDNLLIYDVTPVAGTVVINPGNTNVTYTPPADWNGTDTFLYTVVDGQVGGFDVGVATVDVTPVNDMPSFTKGTNEAVNEDCGPQSVPAWATAISAGPANESAQVLTFDVTNDNNTLFSTQPAIAADGTLTYTPAADSNGVATVSVSLYDDATAGGGALTTAVQTFTITVSAVNDMPSFVKGANQTADEDCGPQTAPGWATAISAGPANESAQVLAFNVSNDNNALFSTQPAVAADGTLTYTPAANANGAATVSVSLSDDATAGGGALTTAVQTFTITVNPVQDNPVAVADDVITAKNTPIVINVLANDYNIDDTNRVLLIYSTTQGTDGTVTVDAGNTFVTYSPSNDWVGVDSFSYIISDGIGGIATGEVTVVVVEKAQLYHQLPSGQVETRVLNLDATTSTGVSILPLSTPWVMRGAGDVDGDGIPDLIWQSPSGQVTCWFMQTNGNYRDWTYVTTVTNTWQIRGVRDIDRDGIADLLWQSTNGLVTCWFMDTNGTYRDWTYVNKRPTDWLIRGAGDIDKDGIADIIWQAPAGQATCWFMQTNATYRDWTYVNPGTTTWKIRAAGDVDGDGAADLVWQASAGQSTCWFMQTNAHMRAWTYINTNATSWQIRDVNRVMNRDR